MHEQSLHSVRKAQRLLDAWNSRDFGALEAELRGRRGGDAAASGTGAHEQERLELLDSITDEMRQDLVRTPLGGRCGVRAETHIRLLEHLAMDGHHAAIRSEKLSVFPCSRLGR
ncbi:MAG TPA: hypothetical protein VLX58_16050 [Bryobacteraceae bacterium]|nr:hypothetical protein [Bryobacteraceae bacterium]